MSKQNSAPVRKALSDAALAWELAATAHPYLSRVDADRIYIALGIGDAFAAIDELVTIIALNQIPLGEDQVATAVTWLDCYLGHDAEPRLRKLLAEVTTDDPPQQMSVAKPPSGPDAAQGAYRRSG